MVRLMIVGASHVPAMQTAWRTLRDHADYADVAVTFLAGPFEDFTFSAEKIGTVPARSAVLAANGQVSEAALDIQDAIVVSGVARFKDIMRVYDVCRAESHVNDTGNPQWVSDPCFEAAAMSVMAEHRAWSVATRLKAATSTPIALTSVPLFKASVVEYPRYKPTLGALRATGDEAALVASWRTAMRTMAAGDFMLLDQPTETLDSPAFTKEEFSVGTYKARNGTATLPDWTHMTPQYGALVMEQCIAWARQAKTAAIA